MAGQQGGRCHVLQVHLSVFIWDLCSKFVHFISSFLYKSPATCMEAQDVPWHLPPATQRACVGLLQLQSAGLPPSGSSTEHPPRPLPFCHFPIKRRTGSCSGQSRCWYCGHARQPPTRKETLWFCAECNPISATLWRKMAVTVFCFTIHTTSHLTHIHVILFTVSLCLLVTYSITT